MTQDDLDRLANDFENTQSFSYEEGATADGYQAGFKKALELVANTIVESPTVNKEFQQTFVKEFFYFI